MEMNAMIEEGYEPRDEILPDFGILPDGDHDAGPSLQDAGGGSFWALVDAGIFGDTEDDGGLDLLDPEEHPDGASASTQESALASLRHLQVTERRRKVLSGRIGITEEDFEEGPQREAFKLLRARCRDTFLKDVKPEDRIRAIEWIFTPKEDPVAFDTCCVALDARPSKLQLRLMYEYFRNWVKFAGPLSFLCVPLPEEIVPELLYVAGEDGVQVASVIWRWPGVTTENIKHALADEMSPAQVERTLHLIDETGIVQCYIESWYVTGKRPKPKMVWK